MYTVPEFVRWLYNPSYPSRRPFIGVITPFIMTSSRAPCTFWCRSCKGQARNPGCIETWVQGWYHSALNKPLAFGEGRFSKQGKPLKQHLKSYMLLNVSWQLDIVLLEGRFRRFWEWFWEGHMVGSLLQEKEVPLKRVVVSKIFYVFPLPGEMIQFD